MVHETAEQGCADAQFTLGIMYEFGDDGVEKDVAKAISWYRKAADQGHEQAQCALLYRLKHTGG